MSWININEKQVPVNDDRYHNKFELTLDYRPVYGHAIFKNKEVVTARYNHTDDKFYEANTGKPISYNDIHSWYCEFDDDEIG